MGTALCVMADLIWRRTSHNIDLHVLVLLGEQLDRVFEGSVVQQDGGDIPKHDSLLWEVWHAADRVQDDLLLLGIGRHLI